MMEVATCSTSEINMLPSETVPVVNVPYLSTDAQLNAVQGATHQLVSLFPDGSIVNNGSQPSYILTTNPDGTSTILLDASQLALLTGQPYGPIYDGTKVFQFSAQDITESPTVTIITEQSELQEQVAVQEIQPVEEVEPVSHLRLPPPLIVTEKRPPIDDEIQPPYKKGQNVCNYCGLEFERADKLEKHLRKHADEKPHKCSKCDASFNLESNLRLHESIHSTSSPTCPECKKTFSRIASLKAHLLMHEVEENMMCTDCGEEFNTEFKYLNHRCVVKEPDYEEEGASFDCKKCSRKFVKMMHLREHMKVHRKLKACLTRKKYKMYVDRSNFPHKCYTCGKQFKKPSQLVRHVRIHTGEKPFRCDLCSKSFNQKGALTVHLNRHNGMRPHLCSFCPATFTQKGNLRAHILRVHMIENSEKVHQCPECSCLFKKIGSLHTHMRRVHTEIESTTNTSKEPVEVDKQVDQVISQLLDIAIQNPNNLSETEQQIQKIAENTKVNADILQQALENSGLAATTEIVRDLPDKGTLNFLSKSLVMCMTDTATGRLNRHLVKKVGNVRYYECLYCRRHFKKPSDLIRHIRIHTHEKPYKCHLCFRAFSVKSTLKAHTRTHSGEKPFKCDVCFKLFATQGSLKVHILLHTGAKPYPCEICGKNFRTSGHCKSHMRSHSKENISPNKKTQKDPKPNENNVSVPSIPLPEPIFITGDGYLQSFVETSKLPPASELPADRPHHCQICMKGFKKSSHLKQHIRSHTGEKPYECTECNRNFVSNGVLKAHIKTHSGVKPYKCDTCEATFTTRGSVKRHSLIHTDERPFMCPYCQKTFKTPLSCKKHMKSHRQELAETGAAGVTVTIISDTQSAANGTPQSEEIVETVTDQEVIEQPESRPDVNESVHPSVVSKEPISKPVQEIVPVPQEHIVYKDMNQEITSSAAEPQPSMQNVVCTDISLVQEQPKILDSVPSFIRNTQEEFHAEQPTIPNIPTSASSAPLTSVCIDDPLATADLPNLLDQVGNTATISSEPLVSETQQLKRPKLHKIITCEECGKEFKKPSSYAEHARCHSGQKPHRCNTCGKMFSSQSNLRNHVKLHGKDKNEFVCRVCHSVFTSKSALSRHLITHGNLTRCSYCSEIFDSYESYQNHLTLYHQDVSMDVEPVSSYEKSTLSKSQMPKRQRPLPIQITEEQTEQLAKQNPEEAESISEKVLIAAAVEKNKQKVVEEQSANGKEQSGSYAHSCTYCGKSFKKPSDLVRHIRIHTGEKPFTCNVCNKNFTVKSTLDSHVKTHLGEKNFVCHVCESQFSTKGSLKVHMRLHTGSKPFKCPYCDMHFRTSGHRKSHVACHFKGPPHRQQKQAKVSTLLQSLQNQNAGASTELNVQNQEPEQTVIATKVTQVPPTPQNVNDGIQLQLTPSLMGQNIQITGVDPNMLSKPIHIDAGLLQQLQQQININITISPSVMSGQDAVIDTLEGQAVTDVASISSLPSNGTITINPSLFIPQLGFAIAKPSEAQETNSVSSVNYSIMGQTTTSAPEDISIINGVVGHAVGGNEDVVFLSEAVEESSVVIGEQMVEATDGNAMELTALKSSGGASGQILNISESGKCFTCSICDKMFSKKSQLTSHRRTHKEQNVRKSSERRMYQCIHCEVSFMQKKSLHAHMKKLHAVS